MNYWIRSVLDEEGEPSKEVVVVDEDDVVVARGALEVDFVSDSQGLPGDVRCGVRFVGMVVE